VRAREAQLEAELPTNDLEERIKVLVETIRKSPIAWERLMADADLCKTLNIETKFDKVFVFELNASSTLNFFSDWAPSLNLSSMLELGKQDILDSLSRHGLKGLVNPQNSLELSEDINIIRKPSQN
jgi:hypothetical protein